MWDYNLLVVSRLHIEVDNLLLMSFLQLLFHVRIVPHFNISAISNVDTGKNNIFIESQDCEKVIHIYIVGRVRMHAGR